VQILQEDAIDAIKRVYQVEDALIYVDPPYLGHEKEYRFGVDYQKLVDTLRDAKCKVIVSEYLTAEFYYDGWCRVEKTTAGRARIGAHNTKAKEKTEVLFMNFYKKC